ncbi:MAG: two-component system response regulator [Actinomycetaceae bacterium]|nr:two-component system response regulator [Actinomycetaceae bacterium]
MSDERAQLKVLLYSDDVETRRAVMDAVGVRAAAGMAPVEWVEAATAEGAVTKFAENQIDALILDGETQKEGGMAVLRRLHVEHDNVAPAMVLIARPQDEWLARFAGSSKVITTPLDPIEVRQALAELLQK